MSSNVRFLSHWYTYFSRDFRVQCYYPLIGSKILLRLIFLATVMLVVIESTLLPVALEPFVSTIDIGGSQYSLSKRDGGLEQQDKERYAR